ncbi:T9SS type A sorting domain-containing protein, partial [candidate division KSB1 bacterium]|nr:T9SS type A sorting domain-containing protein [candidate division KSB1 bacterium]
YAGVWCGNQEQHGWAWALNYDWNEFSNLLDQYNSDGYRLIDYEKYMTSGGMRYGGVWVKDGTAGGYSINYSNQSDFSSRIESRKNDDNFRPVKFEMYTDLATSVEQSGPEVVSTYELSQNYPNPFNPQTTIDYSIPAEGFVSLKVYNLQGQEIASLINMQQQAGRYSVPFNATGLVSGIYVYRLEFKGEKSFVKTRKMSLLK